MMNPMFLNNNKNTEYFDLNQDHYSYEDQQQNVLESSTFHPPSFAVSNISNLHLEQGVLGMSASHSMSDQQSLAFDHQLEGSKNMFLDMVSPTYGAQMSSTNNINYGSQNHEIFIFKQQEADQEPNNQNKSGSTATDHNNGSSLRWMSSKMRIMRRMINSNDTKTGSRNGTRIIPGNNNPDHCPQLNVVSSDHNTNIFNTNNYGIRVCSDCNTTKTPLWRSGPQGPKTLCNACGIRQRKARKAAMEAAAAAASAATNSSCEAASYSSTSSKTKIKLKISNNKEKNKSRATTSNTCVSQHINKKQTTYNKQQTDTQLVDSDHTNNSSTSNSSSKRQMFFEEFAVKLLSKNAAFHRMFPQDEEEGALLLMTLSYDFNES